MKKKVEELTPGYFLVGDGRSRLYINEVESTENEVHLHHQWGTLTFTRGDEVEAARPMTPRPLPSDL